MRNRRRNWFIKRIALGFAVAAFVAPVAQAKVDEGIQGQLNTASENVKPIPYRWPSSADKLNPSDNALTRGDQIEVVRVEQPRSTGSDIVAADYGMPRAMPHDYALTSGDQIEVVRAEPRGTSSDDIEFTRVNRWYPVLVYSHPGLYKKLGRFHAARDRNSRIHLAGSYNSSGNVNTATTAGERAARELLQALERTVPAVTTT